LACVFAAYTRHLGASDLPQNSKIFRCPARLEAEPLQGHALTLSMQVDIAGTQYRFSWGRAQAGMARKVAAAMPGGS
jgi:hypothetical protein